MHLNCCWNTIFSAQRWMFIRLREAHWHWLTLWLGWQPTAFTLTPWVLLQAFALSSLLLCQTLAFLSLLFQLLSEDPGYKPWKSFVCSAPSHHPSSLIRGNERIWELVLLRTGSSWGWCASGIISKGIILTRWDFTFLPTAIMLILNINHINI